MGPSQISDPPFKVMSCWGLISDVVVSQFWAHKGTCSSESALLDIHGVVRREGNPQKRKPSPCKHVCFASCLHILHIPVLHMFIDSPLELAPFRLPHCCFTVKFLCGADKLVLLLKGLSCDSPMWACTVLLAYLLTLCCRFMKVLSGKVLPYQQIPNYLENQKVNFSILIGFSIWNLHFWIAIVALLVQTSTRLWSWPRSATKRKSCRVGIRWRAGRVRGCLAGSFEVLQGQQPQWK